MSEETATPKKQKKSPGDGDCENAGASNISQSPRIFKMNIDCLDKIFDYLSLKDLHSFGLTCRTMQQVVGEYFKLNFHAAAKFAEDDGIYTVYSDAENQDKRIQTSGFNEFITYISHYYEKMQPLEYIKLDSDEFVSINHIYLVCLNLNKPKIEAIRKLLRKVEIVQLRNCSVQVRFYEDFLALCDNLKQLYYQEAHQKFHFAPDETHWLLQTYPKLEHLEFSSQFRHREINLGSFFDRNQTIKSFSTSSCCLLENGSDFLKSNAKLEVFEVKVFQRSYYYDVDHRNVDALIPIRNLLIQLYERGFYKRLHFYVRYCDRSSSDEIVQLPGLEKLCIHNFTEAFNLYQLSGVKELVIQNGANPNEMHILANSLQNLQRLFLASSTIENLLPFIRHSPKLGKIKFFPNRDGNNGLTRNVLKISMLDEERKKLDGFITKVTIYVEDNIFLATKWAIHQGNMNLKFVEIKRTDSYAWDNHY